MATTGGAGQIGNSTVNVDALPLVEVVVIGTLVSVVIVGIIVGNAFVVASVAAFREMRTLTNWMIVSLASADLLVAVAVLPLSAYQVRSSSSLSLIIIIVMFILFVQGHIKASAARVLWQKCWPLINCSLKMFLAFCISLKQSVTSLGRT